jgi:hypothetical protein
MHILYVEQTFSKVTNMLSIACFSRSTRCCDHVDSTSGIHHCIILRQPLSNVSVVTEHSYTKLNCCIEMTASTVQQIFQLKLGPNLVPDR